MMMSAAAALLASRVIWIGLHKAVQIRPVLEALQAQLLFSSCSLASFVSKAGFLNSSRTQITWLSLQPCHLYGRIRLFC
jgi:hypothetical protein